MDIKCAKISNQSANFMNPGNAVGVFKGQKGACCLACGVNMPKSEAQSTPDKVAELVIDSFMRRPSLSSEAFDAIFKLANDRVLVNQSPQYPSFVSASAVFFLKNKFALATAGDNVIFHFVDGVLKNVFTGDGGADPLYLGHLRYSSPKVSEQIAFGKGENTFLICSRSFAQSFTENRLEEELIRATHVTQKGKNKISEVKVDRWLKALWDELGNVNPAEDFSAVAFTLPAKQKSAKGLIIGIIVAVVVLVAAFFAVGFFTRRPPENQPPAPPSQDENIDYDKAEHPVGPNGEMPPDPPKR